MWPSPSPAWQTSPCSHPGTSSMRSHSSPQTSWSTPSTLLFPGVPQGHPPPQQLHRDHVPPGYQFSTSSILETAPPHTDSTFYVPGPHHHPTFQPVFGIPPPTEPPPPLDQHNETFSEMIRRYPSRPTWASIGHTDPSWTGPTPMAQPQVPQHPQPQPPQHQPLPVPPIPTSAPPPSSTSAPPTSPPPPPATPKRAESTPSRRRRDQQDIEDLPQPIYQHASSRSPIFTTTFNHSTDHNLYTSTY